jgi:hypothetical protein
VGRWRRVGRGWARARVWGWEEGLPAGRFAERAVDVPGWSAAKEVFGEPERIANLLRLKHEPLIVAQRFVCGGTRAGLFVGLAAGALRSVAIANRATTAATRDPTVFDLDCVDRFALATEGRLSGHMHAGASRGKSRGERDNVKRAVGAQEKQNGDENIARPVRSGDARGARYRAFVRIYSINDATLSSSTSGRSRPENLAGSTL